MNPKSNANCPYKREAEGNYIDQSEGVNIQIEAKTGAM